MNLFVITKKDDSQIEIPVHVERNGNPKTVLAFMERSKAEDFIEVAGWSSIKTIATLDGEELVRWLVALQDVGVDSVVLDPVYHLQDRRLQRTITVADLVRLTSNVLASRIRALSAAKSGCLGKRLTLHCQRCGKILERALADSFDECCGNPMAVALG